MLSCSCIKWALGALPQRGQQKAMLGLHLVAFMCLWCVCVWVACATRYVWLVDNLRYQPSPSTWFESLCFPSGYTRLGDLWASRSPLPLPPISPRSAGTMHYHTWLIWILGLALRSSAQFSNHSADPGASRLMTVFCLWVVPPVKCTVATDGSCVHWAHTSSLRRGLLQWYCSSLGWNSQWFTSHTWTELDLWVGQPSRACRWPMQTQESFSKFQARASEHGMMREVITGTIQWSGGQGAIPMWHADTQHLCLKTVSESNRTVSKDWVHIRPITFGGFSSEPQLLSSSTGDSKSAFPKGGYEDYRTECRQCL